MKLLLNVHSQCVCLSLFLLNTFFVFKMIALDDMFCKFVLSTYIDGNLSTL
jgi:hypothetical protein